MRLGLWVFSLGIFVPTWSGVASAAGPETGSESATSPEAASSQGAGAEGEPARSLTPEEMQAWLERPADEKDHSTEPFDAIPPPAPRHRGISLESSLGALGFLGAAGEVSPLSPWLGVRLGLEPWRWLAVFATADVTFSSTSLASPPPPPRSYRLYAFGAGLRVTPWSGERFGVFAEGDAGLCWVDSDILEVYGFPSSTSLEPFVDGRLGVAWYPVNPHVSLTLSGGVRGYLGTFRSDPAISGSSTSTGLSILSAVALRYTF